MDATSGAGLPAKDRFVGISDKDLQDSNDRMRGGGMGRVPTLKGTNTASQFEKITKDRRWPDDVYMK